MMFRKGNLKRKRRSPGGHSNRWSLDLKIRLQVVVCRTAMNRIKVLLWRLTAGSDNLLFVLQQMHWFYFSIFFVSYPEYWFSSSACSIIIIRYHHITYSKYLFLLRIFEDLITIYFLINFNYLLFIQLLFFTKCNSVVIIGILNYKFALLILNPI